MGYTFVTPPVKARRTPLAEQVLYTYTPRVNGGVVSWMSNVLPLNHHPKRVQEQVRAYAADLGKVVFSQNINDLALARTISMRDVWACLEEGLVVEKYLTFGPEGTYCKLMCHTGGETVYLDVCFPPDKDYIEVLYATNEEL